jgi:hypothetical protein
VRERPWKRPAPGRSKASPRRFSTPLPWASSRLHGRHVRTRALPRTPSAPRSCAGLFCPCATNRRETASPSKSGARSLQRPSLSDNATVDSSGLQDFEIGSFGALEPLCGTLLLTSLRQFSGENFERRVAAVPAPAPVEVPVGVERPLPKSPSRCKSHSIWARARLVWRRPAAPSRTFGLQCSQHQLIRCA